MLEQAFDRLKMQVETGIKILPVGAVTGGQHKLPHRSRKVISML